MGRRALQSTFQAMEGRRQISRVVSLIRSGRARSDAFGAGVTGGKRRWRYEPPRQHLCKKFSVDPARDGILAKVRKLVKSSNGLVAFDLKLCLPPKTK